MSFSSRHAERLSRERLRVERRKNPATLKGQLDFEKVEQRSFNQRVGWKGGLTSVKNVPSSFLEGEQELAAAAPPLPLDEVEQAQVSFLVQKKCLRCKRVNKYAAIECGKCHGRFVFDKTGADHVPKLEGDEKYGSNG